MKAGISVFARLSMAFAPVSPIHLGNPGLSKVTSLHWSSNPDTAHDHMRMRSIGFQIDGRGAAEALQG